MFYPTDVQVSLHYGSIFIMKCGKTAAFCTTKISLFIITVQGRRHSDAFKLPLYYRVLSQFGDTSIDIDDLFPRKVIRVKNFVEVLDLHCSGILL